MEFHSIHEAITALKQGIISPQELIEQTRQSLTQRDSTHHIINHRYTSQFSQEKKTGPLAGIPIVIKDNIFVEGEYSSCGSEMLRDYKAPYTATCAQKLIDAGATILGSANMDEFAMGSTTESSAFGPTKNVWGIDRIPGGSSGGSAVAVACGAVFASLGTDTGGSIRQPAALCGIVGYKPTYGRVSRYGVQAMASSLDQVGVFARNVTDARFVADIIAGYDPRDATSLPDDIISHGSKIQTLKGIRFGFPVQFFNDGLDSEIATMINGVRALLSAQGAECVDLDIPLLEHILPIYYTLMPAEVASNLARFDGIRFGLQYNTKEYNSIEDYYRTVRSAGFGEEVKRRIMLGNYVLSSSQYDGLYLKALKLRHSLGSHFSQIYQNVDCIISPTTPTPAWKIGTNNNDPLSVYLSDIYTITANLIGAPALSMPLGRHRSSGEDLPVGLQLMSSYGSDHQLFDLAELVETLLGQIYRKPSLA